jgi:hypothetical protein
MSAQLLAGFFRCGGARTQSGVLARMRQGDTIEAAIDERPLHLFDAQTGLAIR